jgi:pimeloyl-ACP methyl ester carboxylesterase
MSRADVLSLAAALYLEGYNVLTYDTRGSGAIPRGASSLGLQETDDMMSALNFLKSRPEVDTKCLGIWGVDVNARAALKIAASEPAVRAVAADSVYDSVQDFLGVLIREDLGWDSRVLEFGCRQIFRLYMIGSAAAVDEHLPHSDLGRRSILFIKGDNRADVGRLTTALYNNIQPQRELMTVPTARARLMSSEELNGYDRQVTNFFREHLR